MESHWNKFYNSVIASKNVYCILTFHSEFLVSTMLYAEGFKRSVCGHAHLSSFSFTSLLYVLQKESSYVFLIYLLNIINSTKKKSIGKIVDKQRWLEQNII